MLSFVIKDCSGKCVKKGMPLTVVINSDCTVPADGFTVTFPLDTIAFENGDFIELYKDEVLVIKGQIDEVTDVCTANAAVTRISARSLAALLLDNEAEPVTYVNPAAGFIFERHLKRFGITEYSGGEEPLFANLKINKGMTHWQVFENYCSNKYGKFPRITGDGKALFEGYNGDGLIVLSDKRSDINYFSIKRKFMRCKLISDVKLKLNDNGLYDGCISNTNEESKGIERVRLVNALTDTTSIGTADKIIAQSNINSLRYIVECVGCYADVLGKSAVIKDKKLGVIENLIVDRLKYTLDSSGETTLIELRRK